MTVSIHRKVLCHFDDAGSHFFDLAHADVERRIHRLRFKAMLPAAPNNALFRLKLKFETHDVLNQIRVLFECLKTAGGYVDLDC